jgi:hypothetical protein
VTRKGSSKRTQRQSPPRANPSSTPKPAQSPQRAVNVVSVALPSARSAGKGSGAQSLAKSGSRSRAAVAGSGSSSGGLVHAKGAPSGERKKASRKNTSDITHNPSASPIPTKQQRSTINKISAKKPRPEALVDDRARENRKETSKHPKRRVVLEQAAASAPSAVSSRVGRQKAIGASPSSALGKPPKANILPLKKKSTKKKVKETDLTSRIKDT